VAHDGHATDEHKGSVVSKLSGPADWHEHHRNVFNNIDIDRILSMEEPFRNLLGGGEYGVQEKGTLQQEQRQLWDKLDSALCAQLPQYTEEMPCFRYSKRWRKSVLHAIAADRRQGIRNPWLKVLSTFGRGPIDAEPQISKPPHVRTRTAAHSKLNTPTRTP
jgi:hypothetical protein